MSDFATRYDRVAGQFTERVEAVPPDAWDNPAPCDGWVARDVVRHLVEWIPGFFASYADLPLNTGPSVDVDPPVAWRTVDTSLRDALADPDVAGREFEMPVGRYTVEAAIDMFCTGDILVHTWDLARATGLDETLDAGEVHRMLDGIEAYDDAMRQSGQYGPRVPVPDDADDQTRLIAFTGRHP